MSHELFYSGSVTKPVLEHSGTCDVCVIMSCYVDRSLCDTFMIVKGEDRISKQANENATMLMKCLVRSVLCSRKVIEEHRLSLEAFEWLIGEYVV